MHYKFHFIDEQTDVKSHGLSPIPPDLTDLTWMFPLAEGGCQPAPDSLNVPQLNSIPERGHT